MTVFQLSARPDLRRSPLLEAESNLVLAAGELANMTVYSRTGFRGPAAEAFLQQQKLPMPERPNMAVEVETGLWILRLSATEFWLVDICNRFESLIASIEKAANEKEGLYPLFCQHSHCCFVVQGDHLADVFAKVCGVDLQPAVFPVGSIAQTSLARTNAVIVRVSQGEGEMFVVLSDISGAAFLWASLCDAFESRI